MTGPIEIRGIPAAAARPLRSSVLRPGLPLEANIYPGDEDPASFHAGAYLGEKLVGVASVFQESAPAEQLARLGIDQPILTRSGAWRLRGMAVDAGERGSGYGRQLVVFCLDHIRAQGGQLLWCNARASVSPFYQKLGFQAAGREFDIPESGLHYVMWRFIE